MKKGEQGISLVTRNDLNRTTRKFIIQQKLKSGILGVDWIL